MMIFRALNKFNVVPDRAASGKEEGGRGKGCQGRACDHHSEFIMADTILSVIHEDISRGGGGGGGSRGDETPRVKIGRAWIFNLTFLSLPVPFLLE